MAEREWAALRGTRGHLFEDFIVSTFRSERPDTVELVPPEPGELQTDLKLHLNARTQLHELFPRDFAFIDAQGGDGKPAEPGLVLCEAKQNLNSLAEALDQLRARCKARSPSAVFVAVASERNADKAALRRTLQQACAKVSTAGLPRLLLCCVPFNA